MRRALHAGVLRCTLCLALSPQRRGVIPGQFPTDSSPAGGSDLDSKVRSGCGQAGWELRRGHHLQSSVGLHSPFPTACGRMFNPQLYYEVLQACCDQQWLQAIQREMRNDAEWMETLRTEGGVARSMNALTESTQHDDELMMKLRETLRTDRKMSLTLCAIQESYERIRRKRDMHETKVAADGGNDTYASMRQRQQGQFGSNLPSF
ncbi:putative complement regulatory protein [Trypanosoma theileri]|uniref:Putative complement regulatory protein n=1 Tax=Trypanosoma theileri TaxID=67003 RepID=A0A1X0P4E1_9TRYP|nr:putative complement regulatory protein [Trypanosoma theileri]ORC91814.1 putative complement regulatory protein [Trypanosoma theileri]